MDPPRRELGIGVAEAFRMFSAGVAERLGAGVKFAVDRSVPRPVPVMRDRDLEEAMDTDRVERRDEGGAYSDAGSGGYGSMMSTSWIDVVPKPTP